MFEMKIGRLHGIEIGGSEFADIMVLLRQLHGPEYLEPSYEELQMHADENLLFVASTKSNALVGMATLVTYYHFRCYWGIVEEVVVAEEWRGQGIGKSLMQAVMDSAVEKKLERVFLTSNHKRKVAHALYESLGFKKVDTNLFRWEFEE